MNHVSWTKRNNMSLEGESRYRPWIFSLVFCCSSSIFVRWFCLHSFVSGVRSLFGAHPKMRAVIFVCLYISVSRLQLTDFYLIVSGCQLTFKSESSAYFHLVLEGGGSDPFLVVPHLRRCFGNSGFFESFLITAVIHPLLGDQQPVLFNWVTRRSTECFCRLTVSFFLVLFFFSPSLSLSLIPQKLASRSLYNSVCMEI